MASHVLIHMITDLRSLRAVVSALKAQPSIKLKTLTLPADLVDDLKKEAKAPLTTALVVDDVFIFRTMLGYKDCWQINKHIEHANHVKDRGYHI